MANVNLTNEPSNYDVTYYINGNNNGQVEISLDPNNTPIYYTFESEILSLSPQKASIIINFWGPTFFGFDVVNVGNTITIHGVTFTASTNPTNNEFFNCNSSFTQRELSCNSLANAINSNNELNWRYIAQPVINNPNVSLTLIALNTGSKYSFVINDNISIVPIAASKLISNVAGTDANRGQLLEPFNYSVFIEIWKPIQNITWARKGNTANARLVTTLSQQWNSSNRFTFDVSPYLVNDTIIPFPGISTGNTQNITGMNLINTAISSYYIKWGEQFNGGFNIITSLPIDDTDNITNSYIRKYFIGQHDLHWTSKGALELNINNPNWRNRWQNPFHFIPNPDPNTLTNSQDIIYFSWLTEQPQYKLIRRSSDIQDYELAYIYVMNEEEFSNVRNYRLRLELLYIDGSTATQFHSLGNNINASGLYYMDVSYQALSLVTYEALLKLRSYTVVLEVFRNANWVDYSSPLNYDIDLNYEPDNYQKIWWRNKFGAFDQFEFEGLEVNTINVDPINYQRSLQINQGYQRDKRVNAVYRKDTSNRITFNTGWLDETHFNWIKSLLVSNEIYTRAYYLRQFGFTFMNQLGFVPINITNYTYEMNNIDRLFNMQIEFEVAIDENNIHD